ncbi:MAG: rod shape-determining protein MreD [Bacteroidaceae bacterium]|nr:rod shape-determining protein MreD [Bacteroidaceae bacterium]
MIITFIKRFSCFWLLVLLQAFILNNINFFGYATPFLYVYLILTFNANMSRYSLLFWGFFLGLAVDIFSNTLGINAISTTLLAFVRPTLLTLFASRDSADDFTPSIHSMGLAPFIRYVSVAILIHQTALILLLTFSFAHPLTMLLKVVASAILTTLCVWGIDAVKK